VSLSTLILSVGLLFQFFVSWNISKYHINSVKSLAGIAQLGIANGYGLACRAGAQDFSLLYMFQTGSEAYSAPSSMGTGLFSPGAKLAGA
jgi:hypothetical protein